MSSYIKCFVGFNFILGNANSSVLHTFFDKLVKVLQGDYKSAQLIIFIIGTCFLDSSIAEDKDAI